MQRGIDVRAPSDACRRGCAATQRIARPSRRLEVRVYAEDDADVFEVSRLVGTGKVAAVVQFERVGRRIHIQGEDIDVDLTAIVTVDTSGMCRFVVGEAMYSDWELRRMALELLFFEEIEEPE